MKTILCCLFPVVLGFVGMGVLKLASISKPLAPEDKEEK